MGLVIDNPILFTMSKIVLTGIKPTGHIHLGNYIGAIKPAIARQGSDHQCFYFVADYHALTSVHDRDQLNEYVYDVAASWLALGLDPEKSIFYRQSRITETHELAWILACFTPKGLMNRAHAYKAIVAENEAANEKDIDKGVNMGLFTYPVLMAADILLFQSDIVPVGKDQVQHIEIARDMANKFNHVYSTETFKLPTAKLVEEGEIVPGLDGRKMSKSYDNTIPLFAEPKKLEKLIKQIKTDSKRRDEPKDTNTCSLFQLMKHFASEAELNSLKEAYAEGIGYGDVKKQLFSKIDSVLAEPREKYIHFMQNKKQLKEILNAGEQKARPLSKQTLDQTRQVIGLA